MVLADLREGLANVTDPSLVRVYRSVMVYASDYTPFGRPMAGRVYKSAWDYRYGFNGKEYDNEVQAAGNLLDYGNRMYDPMVGRFWSVDPLTSSYPFLTPYQFASNRPIDGVDLDGLEYLKTIPKWEKSGGVFDYVTAVNNGVIGLLNLPMTTWNSTVKNVQELGKGTWKETASGELQQMGQGVSKLAKQFANAPLTTLTSPDAVEFYTEAFIGAKAFNIAPKTGNLLKPAKASTLESVAAKRLTVAFEENQVPIFRGGGDFTLKPGEYKVTPKGKYPARGLSLDANPINLEKYGGAFEIKSIPDELQIIHTPSTKNPAHFDIIPRNTNINESEFQSLLNKIETIPAKK